MEKNDFKTAKKHLDLKIREIYGNHGIFAKAIGMTSSTWSREFGLFNFKTSRIIFLCDALHISVNEVYSYFFEK